MSWIDILKYDKNGLITAVIQDYRSNEVLMVAYMNRQALKKTVKTGKTYFYSRSRKKLWLKGEESGHVQQVKAIFTDCDKDCLLIRVRQKVAACHTGYRSCFFSRVAAGGRLKKTGRRIFDPCKVYK